MSTTLIIIIAVASVLLLLTLLVVAGKISSKRKKKKTMNGELAKKVSKLKKAQAKSPDVEKPKEEFSLQVPKTEQIEIHAKKNIQPIVSDYIDEDLSSVSEPPKHEEIKRTNFEELMKNRAKRMEEQKVNEEIPGLLEDDDFDKFRAKHSVFTSYEKDEALIEEIKNLSPELKAIVFGNLFRRISDDK